MTGLAISFVLQTAMLTAGADGYSDAYHAAQSNGKPLVVLVGTEWCPGCKTMKHGILPRLMGRGKMQRVNFAQVNSDDDWGLASKLLVGDTIPQLVVFAKTPEGWKCEHLKGAKSEAEVEEAIERATTAMQATERLSMTPTSSSATN